MAKKHWYDWLLSLLVAVALLNWGLVAWFSFDLVAWLSFGVSWIELVLKSIVAVVGLIWLISILLRK